MTRTRLLTGLLSVIAGSTDAISLLGFGLFTAHVTGNLAVLAVHAATGRPAGLALLLSIPTFVVAAALARMLATALATCGRQRLRPLLLAELLLFCGFLLGGALAISGTVLAVVAPLLAVSAMGVQNALVQICLPGAPPTTVMTTNLTRLSVAASDLLLGRRRADPNHARADVGRTWPVLLGFVAGAAAGAAGFAAWGMWWVLLPVALALLALVAAGRGDPA